MSPSNLYPGSHVKETTVFTRYLPLPSDVVLTWPFVGEGSAQVATTFIYKLENSLNSTNYMTKRPTY